VASTPTAVKAQRAWLRRRALIARLGARCAGCDQTEQDLMAALEFDHPHGRDWTPAKKNRWQRMVLYERDAAAGNLRLLCRSCNATDGNHRRWRRRGTGGG